MITTLKLTNNALNTEVIQANQTKLQKPSKQPGECWCQRRGAFRRQFAGREREIWEPAFYREWLEYVRAIETGELRGY